MSPSRLDARGRRLWWAAAAGSVLPLVLAAALWAVSLWSNRDQHAVAALLASENLAAAIGDSITAHVGSIDLALAAAAAHVEGDLAQGRIDAERARRHLHALGKQRKEFDGLRVIDRDGFGIVGPGLEGKVRIDFSDRAWFIRQRDDPGTGLLISEPLKSRISGQQVILFSRRLQTPEGAFAGVVSAAVPVAAFTEHLRRIDPGPAGAIALRDLSMRLITRWPEAAPTSPAHAGSSQVSPEMQAQLAGGARRGHFTTDKLDGTPRLVTFQILNRLPLVLVVATAREHYLQPWFTDLAESAAVGGLLGAMYIAAAAFALRELRSKLLAQDRIALLAQVFRNSGESIVLTDDGNRVVEVNAAFERSSGYASEEAIGRSAMQFVSDRTPVKVINEAQAALAGDETWRGELWHRSRQGRDYPVLASISAVRDADGLVSHHVISAIDTTEIKRAQARILHLAHRDPLTRLPNRASLQERLAQTLAIAQRELASVALLFIDLDRFKHVNDTLGHEVGDKLLLEVAVRLRRVSRRSDIVSRLGGDEFVLVLNGLVPPGTQPAAALAEKARLLIDEPFRVAGHELHTSCSIGISLYPDDGQDGPTLMRCADLAMYQAKAEGRNRIAFFKADMDKAGSERLALDLGLQHAIQRQEMFVQYQPQRRMSDRAIVAVEALARWRHPGLGLVPPSKFIAVAEDNGQIVTLGLWVLSQALEQAAQWRRTCAPTLRVTVNVSAVQLMSDGFVDSVGRELARFGLPGDALELEITETAAMRDPERTVAQLHRLRALDVMLAIDDFGTGNSSLAYLKQMPLRCLKLDRSFVRDLEKDSNDATLCRATVQLAHAMGLRVVAEGVESEAQFAVLKALGCDLAQGYLGGRPADAAELTRALQAQSEPPADATRSVARPMPIDCH